MTEAVGARGRRRTGGGAAAALLAAVLTALAIVAALPPPADAHPFGPPPTARIWAEGSQVVIDWGAAPDDAIVIGVELGLLDPGLVDAYLDASMRRPPDPEAEERLSRSPQLRDYLLERIQVWQDGERCAGELQPIGNFVAGGATTTHDCPAPVSAVEVEISLLHEVDDAYRTFAFSAGDAEPAQAVFTAASPRHQWVFGTGAQGADGPALPWGTLGLVALALVVVGGIVLAEVASARRDRAARAELDGAGDGEARAP